MGSAVWGPSVCWIVGPTVLGGGAVWCSLAGGRAPLRNPLYSGGIIVWSPSGSWGVWSPTVWCPGMYYDVCFEGGSLYGTPSPNEHMVATFQGNVREKQNFRKVREKSGNFEKISGILAV